MWAEYVVENDSRSSYKQNNEITAPHNRKAQKHRWTGAKLV